MIQTQATEPGFLDLLTCCGRIDPKDGIRIIGARGIEAGQEETGLRRNLIRGESSTLSHLCDVRAKFGPLPLADLCEKGDKPLPVRTDGRCIGNRVTVG
jgi:hypothetical protein